MSSLEKLLRERRLIVCVGPGGVGKTTVAAALGLQAARLGRRTLVLTIDPARRLATMLGVDGIGDRTHVVPTADIAPARGAALATLSAAMLESEASYDALIHKISADPEHRRSILGNRVYQLTRRSFGASHAYVAMERLHDALQSGEHDLVVLDTPPTRNALEILDAPSRLVGFLDDSVVRWFVPRAATGLRGRLLARGGAAVTRLLAALTGEALVRELGEFFALFLRLREGFRDRATAVQAALRAPDAAFVLVTGATPPSLADAGYLADGLASRGLSLGATVFNRAYVPLERDVRRVTTAATPDRARALAEVLCPAPDPRAGQARALLAEIDALRSRIAADNLAARRAATEFARRLDRTCPCVQTPRLPHELRDLTALAGLGDLLCDGPDVPRQ